MSDVIELTPEVLSPFDTLSDKAVAIRAEGEVAVIGLSDEFKENITAALDWMENKLETDEDFDRAKKAVKDSKEMVKRLKTSLDEMLSGQKEVTEAKKQIEGYILAFSNKGKSLDNSVIQRDKAKKKEITDAGKNELNRVISLSAIAKHFKADTAAIDNAIKSKRKYSAMQEAVDAVVLLQIYNLAWAEAAYIENQILIDQSLIKYPGIYPDKEALSFNNTETLKLIIGQREATQELAIKKQQEKIAEDARIAKEAAEKRKRDIQAAVEKAEREKMIKDEEDARIAVEKAKQSPVVDPPKSEQILPPVHEEMAPPPIEEMLPPDMLPPDPFLTATFNPQRVSYQITLAVPVNATPDQIDEWVRFCTGNVAQIKLDNPLMEYDIECVDVRKI